MLAPPPGSTCAPLDGITVFHALRALQEHTTTVTHLGADGGELSAAQASSFLFVNGLSPGGLPGVENDQAYDIAQTGVLGILGSLNGFRGLEGK